jgi:cystathionine gamma-lyase
MFSDLGITFSFVDFRDPAVVEAAIKPNTKLIFSETPANPTLTLTDLAVCVCVCIYICRYVVLFSKE